MTSSFEKLEQRAAKAEEKAALQKREDSVSSIQEVPGTQLGLPLELLGRGARGAPDSILRSALFSATRPGKRRQLDNEEVAAVSNVTIRQTGPQLQQIDLDVWIELVRLAAESQSSVLTIPLKTFLKRLDRDTGAKSRERLLSTLLRLNACVVSISYNVKAGLRHYNGNMVFEHSRDEKQQLVVQLNPRIAALFESSSWSTLQLEQRHQLKRQPLAQWLHGYYSSHARPFPIKVDTLRTLSGSSAKHLRQFRAELRGAMAKVEGVTGWKWKVDTTDKLIVLKGVSTDASG